MVLPLSNFTADVTQTALIITARDEATREYMRNDVHNCDYQIYPAASNSDPAVLTPQWHLRWDQSLKDIKLGWTFGVGKEGKGSCDVVLSGQTNDTANTRFFRIQYNYQSGYLIVYSSWSKLRIDGQYLLEKKSWSLDRTKGVNMTVGSLEFRVNYPTVPNELLPKRTKNWEAFTKKYQEAAPEKTVFSPTAAMQDLRLGNEWLRNYHVNQRLGQGGYGTVWYVVHKETGDAFAAKEFNNNDHLNSEAVMREIETIKKLKHPHIVAYIANFQTELGAVLMMEYMSMGSLKSVYRQRLAKGEHFARAEVMIISKQVSSALAFIHENSYAHRDIKPENILVQDLGENLTVKVSDFGTTKKYDETRKTICGTFRYMAPEMIDRQIYNELVDIWSLGITVFELTHPLVIPADTQPTNQGRAAAKILADLSASDPSDQFLCLLRAMTSLEANERPSAAKCLSTLEKQFPINPNKKLDTLSEGLRTVNSKMKRAAARIGFGYQKRKRPMNEIQDYSSYVHQLQRWAMYDESKNPAYAINLRMLCDISGVTCDVKKLADGPYYTTEAGMLENGRMILAGVYVSLNSALRYFERHFPKQVDIIWGLKKLIAMGPEES